MVAEIVVFLAVKSAEHCVVGAGWRPAVSARHTSRSGLADALRQYGRRTQFRFDRIGVALGQI